MVLGIFGYLDPNYLGESFEFLGWELSGRSKELGRSWCVSSVLHSVSSAVWML